MRCPSYILQGFAPSHPQLICISVSKRHFVAPRTNNLAPVLSQSPTSISALDLCQWQHMLVLSLLFLTMTDVPVCYGSRSPVWSLLKWSFLLTASPALHMLSGSPTDLPFRCLLSLSDLWPTSSHCQLELPFATIAQSMISSALCTTAPLCRSPLSYRVQSFWTLTSKPY